MKKLIIRTERYPVILCKGDDVFDLESSTLSFTANRKFKPEPDLQLHKAAEIFKAENFGEDSELKNSLNYKKYISRSLGRKRESMPQVDEEHLNDFLLHFGKSVSVKKVKRKLSQLKPSQIEFDDSKVINIANQGQNNDKIYIISKDNYLVDGHHNWGGNLEHDEDAEVTCYRINLGIKELLRRANLLKLTRKEAVNGDNIEKSWSQDLLEANKPARWITYRGNHVLIKMNKDGTGTIVYAGNPALEHMKVIPKTHEEYKKLKEESEKSKKVERKNDEFTKEEIAEMKEAAKQKSNLKKEVKKQYFEKLIDVANLEGVSAEDLMQSGKAAKIENKADKVASTENSEEPVSLKELMKEIKESGDKESQKAAIDTIQELALNQVLEESVGEHPDMIPEAKIDTGNKELDKKLRNLKMTSEQALQIQGLKTQMRHKMKEINKDFADVIKSNQKNLVITSMQGVGIYDLNEDPVGIDDAIASAIKEVENKRRAELNSQFYQMIEQRGTAIDKRIVEGAQDTINALAGKFLGGAVLNKEAIDFIGVENASKVIAGEIHNRKMDETAKKQIDELLRLSAEDLVKNTLDGLKDKFDRIKGYEQLGAEGVLAAQTAAINKARQIAGVNIQLGSAAGSLQAAATILDNLQDVEESKGDIIVDGGKNLITLQKKLHDMGLSDKDYFINRAGARLQVTIPQENYNKLLGNNSVDAQRDEVVKAIKENKLTEKGWLPGGMSKTFYDFKTPAEFNKLENKEGWEKYKNTKGENGYTSQFPEGETLYRKAGEFAMQDSQQRLIKFGIAQKRAVWNAGAGIGKTIAFLGTISDLKHNGKINFGVMTPPSRLVDEFFKDQQKFFPHLRMAKLDGLPIKRRQEIMQEAADGKWDVIISGHDSIKAGLGKAEVEEYAQNKVDEFIEDFYKKNHHRTIAKSLKEEVRKKARLEAEDTLGVANMLASHNPGFVGIDEAHEVFKDLEFKESQKFKAIKQLSRASEYFIPATGTIVRNQIGEVAGIAAITRPDVIVNPKQFTRKWQRINQGSSVMQGAAIDAFRRELDDVMITERTEVKNKNTGERVNLHENKNLVKLTDQQKQAYKDSEALYHLDRKTKGYGIMDDDGNVVKKNENELFTLSHDLELPSDKDGNIPHTAQTKKLLSEAGYDAGKYRIVKLGAGAGARRDSRHSKILHNGDWKTNAKVQEILKNVDKHGEGSKHIVFYQDKASLGTLKQAFAEKYGLKPEQMPHIDGAASAGERKKAVTKYQTTGADTPVIFLSTAGMTGLNLQAADVIHHLGRVNTAALQQQANARAYRNGRQDDVHAYYYDSDTPYDNNRVDTIERKGKLVEAVGEYREGEGIQTAIDRVKKKKGIQKSEHKLIIKL